MSSKDMNELMNMPIDEVIEKHMDEITDPDFLEFIKGIQMFRETLVNEKEPEPLVYKMLYNPETMISYATTTEETDQPYIEITQEQFMTECYHYPHRIIGNTFERIPLQEAYDPKLPLTEGDKWKTSEDNMLIMGKDKGWDERKNS